MRLSAILLGVLLLLWAASGFGWISISMQLIYVLMFIDGILWLVEPFVPLSLPVHRTQ